MNLIETLVALMILAISSSFSLQLWASSTTSAEAAEQRQHQLGQLEVALLGSQARLAALEALPMLGCADAASWLVGHLQSQSLGAGLSREVSAEPGAALVRVRISAPEVGERQRWFSPAAYGLCGPNEPETQEHIDATL